MTLKVSTATGTYRLQRVFPSDSWVFLFVLTYSMRYLIAVSYRTVLIG